MITVDYEEGGSELPKFLPEYPVICERPLMTSLFNANCFMSTEYYHLSNCHIKLIHIIISAVVSFLYLRLK